MELVGVFINYLNGLKKGIDVMLPDGIVDFFINVIAVGGGSAAIAYVIFMYWGKKWLDDKFAKQLQDFKHTQSIQMEQYRFEINSLFNRITKIHEKEFDVLPTSWSKLQDALGRVAKLMSPLQTYPDLNIKNEAQIEETLAKTELTESQKDDLRNSDDKNQTFKKKRFFGMT